MRRRLIAAILVLALLLAPLPVGQAAGVATLIVNSADDSDDTKCNSGHCTLREAINAANANPGADTIHFAIPSSDPNCSKTTTVCTIAPASELPAIIDDDTTINGYTQGDVTCDSVETVGHEYIASLEGRYGLPQGGPVGVGPGVPLVTVFGSDGQSLTCAIGPAGIQLHLDAFRFGQVPAWTDSRIKHCRSSLCRLGPTVSSSLHGHSIARKVVIDVD